MCRCVQHYMICTPFFLLVFDNMSVCSLIVKLRSKYTNPQVGLCMKPASGFMHVCINCVYISTAHPTQPEKENTIQGIVSKSRYYYEPCCIWLHFSIRGYLLDILNIKTTLNVFQVKAPIHKSRSQLRKSWNSMNFRIKYNMN